MSRIYINHSEIEEVIVKPDKKMTIVLKPENGMQVSFNLLKNDRTNRLRKILCNDVDVIKPKEEQKPTR